MGLVLKPFVKTKVCLSICYTKVDVTRSQENHCGFKGNRWKFPFWYNEVTHLEEPTSFPQKSKTVIQCTQTVQEGLFYGCIW